MLLAPLQTGLLAVDPQPQPVFIARRDLARPQHPTRPVVEPKQDVNVVVEPAARYEAAQVGRQLARLEAGDDPPEIVRVRADIAKPAAAAPRRRNDAPRRRR